MTDRQDYALYTLNKVASAMSKRAEEAQAPAAPAEPGLWDKTKAKASEWKDYAVGKWNDLPTWAQYSIGYGGAGLGGAGIGAALDRKNRVRGAILGALLGTGAVGAVQGGNALYNYIKNRNATKA